MIKKITIIMGLFFAVSSGIYSASKKTIVCSTFPEYDWVKNIAGEASSEMNIVLLQDKGTDLHSFQPSFKDIVTISTCDFFIYTGGESEGWVKKALENKRNKEMVVVSLLEITGDRVFEEEIAEGMQCEENQNAQEDDEVEYDEHVWLSVKNACVIVKSLSANLQALFPEKALKFRENTENYCKKLEDLDRQFEEICKTSRIKTVLFADRFPFLYLTEDYGLKYFAAFSGCSAESEASFDTISFLAKKVDELGLKYVLKIEKSDARIAKSIICAAKNKNQQILTMDSLQSVTKDEIDGGKSYLTGMKKNLEVLKKALN